MPTKAFLTLFSLTVMLSLLFVDSSAGYPQYAIQVGQNRCTACHISPVGGGLRNLDGKYFGFRNFKPSPYARQDLFSADARALFFYPQKPTSTKGGAGIMALNVAANIPLSQEEDPTETRFVVEHNLGGFPAGQGGPRDAYVRWRVYKETEYNWYPQYIIVGRYHSPFGLLTDEHRTYTKLQTKNTWNDYDGGALFSGDCGPSVHYDMALASGAKTAGAGLGQGATHWGGTINVRLSPPSLPFLVGASASYYEAAITNQSPRANAVYSVISIGRLSQQYVPATLLIEYATAEDWNSSLAGFFASPTYQNSVSSSQSSALWAQLDYKLSERTTFTYKYDTFTPDHDFPADYYERHGVGFRYRQTAHLSVMARAESARATPTSEKVNPQLGGQDAAWILFLMNL